MRIDRAHLPKVLVYLQYSKCTVVLASLVILTAAYLIQPYFVVYYTIAASDYRAAARDMARLLLMMLRWALAAALLGAATAAAPRPHFVFLLIDGELACVPL